MGPKCKLPLFLLLLLMLWVQLAVSTCPFHIISGDVTTNSVYIQASLRHPSCRANPSALTAQAMVRVSKHPKLFKPIFSKNISVFSFAGVDPRQFPGSYVAKVTVPDLKPGTRYYYMFIDEVGTKSPVGQVTTLRAKTDHRPVHILHMSCANRNPYPVAGALYRYIRDKRPHFSLFNGDTVYSDRSWLPENLTEFDNVNRCCRLPVPSIDYFRSLYEDQREASYTGVGFPAALRLMPTFVTWDDHEVFDNYAGNVNKPRMILDSLPLGSPSVEVDRISPHTAEAYFRFGYQAFFDFNAVKPGHVLQTEDYVAGVSRPERRIFRRFSAGKDVDVFILDTRQYRDSPVPARGLMPVFPKGLPPNFFCTGGQNPGLCALFGSSGNQEGLRGANKTMLGKPQKKWLLRGLKRSKAKFKLVVSSVVMLEFFIGPSDRWEGYWKEREEIIGFIEKEKIRGVSFLAGDIHSSIFSRINPGREPAIHEFTTGSIGSDTGSLSLGALTEAFRQLVSTFAANSHLLPPGTERAVKYMNLKSPNFMSLKVEDGVMTIKCIGPDGEVVVDGAGKRGEYVLH